MGLDEVDLRLVDNFDEARRCMEWLAAPRRAGIGFDTETTGLSIEKDHVRLVQVGDENVGWAMQWDRWSGLFADIIKRWDGDLYAHNAPFDVQHLAKMGANIDRRRVKDTRPMAHILRPDRSTALKSLSVTYVDEAAQQLQDGLVLGEDAGKGWTWATVPIEYEPYWTYGALDPVLATQLAHELEPRVMAEAPAAYAIENSVQWVTAAMERYGARVDVPYALEHYEKFKAYGEQVRLWCQKNYGCSPGSNQEVIAALQREGVAFDKVTARGAVALDKDVLSGIDHPLARAVLTRRQTDKIASTYLQHYITESDDDGIIHPSFNALGARTGRMSSSRPNFQNLPRPGESAAGTVVRNCIVARPGNTLIFVDFDQIEMRILAWLSADPNLVAAFASDEDFFIYLARIVFADPTISDKKDPRRRLTKNTGYATIYGAGAAKLALTAGVPFEQAQFAKHSWDTSFPDVRVFQDTVYRQAMSYKAQTGTGFGVCPLTGRRHPADPGKEYALVNYLIQGVAASLFKLKLLELDAAGLGEWMVAPVHDEVILDVPNEHVVDVVETLNRVMNDDQVIAPVRMSASPSYGLRWGTKKDWDVDGWTKLLQEVPA